MSPTRLLLALCLASPLLVANMTAQAGEVYKWMDSKGKSHFSDKPPGTDEGHPKVQTLFGIPKSIQERIRDLAGKGVSISTITGEGRQCLIKGESAAHVMTVAFVKRLADANVGSLATTLSEDSSADNGVEPFELQLVLNKEMVEQSRSLH